MTQAIIVFAHGSKDTLWRQPVEAVAARVQALAPGVQVRCAYLEWTAPPLMSAMSELVTLGAKSIRILPMFLGIGKHLREDLPLLIDELIAQYPEVQVSVLPSVGENLQVIDLLAQISLGLKPIDD
jgi:sirohydrochlorin cobaltochelatase